MTGTVPFVDLSWQHHQVAAEIQAGFERVMQTTAFIDGPDVAAFEEAFARFCGTSRAVGVANGTDAIELMLRGLGIGPGDEVIVPANTFIATVEAVCRAGAVPVVVDCDTFDLIDVDAVGDAICPRTAAILAVDLYGQLADLTHLGALAERAGIVLLEDAAQAQGATTDGAGIGVRSRAAATSFYPGKNLGAYGDAGAVVTNDEDLADAIAAIRNHGSAVRYRHERFGCNARLDTLQAVVLNAKLPHLAAWNEWRREAAARYDELLDGLAGVELPRTRPGNLHVWHLYVVRVDRRDEIEAHLRGAGIGVGVHYPVPVHLHPPFAHLAKGPGSFPVAERAADRVLSLPMFPGITASQQERVVEVLSEAVER